MEKVFNDLADNDDFVHDSANSMSYTWHINSRYNWGETADDILVAHQRLRWANQVYFRRNLMPPSLGWWRINDANEWRWALAKAASFDAGFAYFGSVAHQSRYNAALRLEIRDWLNATRAGAFDWPNRFVMQEQNDYFGWTRSSTIGRWGRPGSCPTGRSRATRGVLAATAATWPRSCAGSR